MCTGLPHRLAAALAVYWLIIVELLCKACLATAHADTDTEKDRDAVNSVEVPEHWN